MVFPNHRFVEVKSGATLQLEWTRHLRRLDALVPAHESRTPAGRVVYGGDERHRLRGVEILPWHALADPALWR